MKVRNPYTCYSYNSAIFSSIHARNYLVFSANEFMVKADSNDTAFSIQNDQLYHDVAAAMSAEAKAGKLKRLDVPDCINTYAINFQTSHQNLVLVSNDTSGLSAAYYYNHSNDIISQAGIGCPPLAFQWVCQQMDNTEVTSSVECLSTTICSDVYHIINPADWRPFGSTVEYCLTEEVEQRCKLQLSPQLAGVVIIFNFIKLAALVYTLSFVKGNPLLTLGDAISSFLRRADHTTRGLCLMGKRDRKVWKAQRHNPTAIIPLPYEEKKAKWWTVVGRPRWTACMLL
jgi:hypothetical protein